MTPQPSFDSIARPYRWLEYLAFGRVLERCRFYFLPRLPPRRQALVLGDGDGRFLARLLLQDSNLHADAVDSSAAMLQLLRQRCAAAASARLSTHHISALHYTPPRGCDLVATHFFLDCLTQPELDALIHNIVPKLDSDALWLISDFRIPPGPMRRAAQLLVRSLYLGFRILTGLRTTRLPNYAIALQAAGLTLQAQKFFLGGLLTSEIWAKTPSKLT